MDDIRYKVLWLEDKEKLHEGYQQLADLRNINLVPFTNWVEAKTEFIANIKEWTAVVLDAFCKWDANSEPEENFLNEVLAELRQLFAENQRTIPWYVLSAGTMNNFSSVISSINLRDRKEHIQDWGDLVYYKDDIENAGEQNPLFDNICQVGEEMSNNIVLYRHRDVFKYLGKDAIFCPEARRVLLKALAVVYYPEENLGYKFEGNPLRKVLEYVFRGSIKYGLLPDECFDGHGGVNQMDCCNFFSGKDLKCANGNAATNRVYPAKTFLSGEDASLIWNLKNYSSSESHTKEDDVYVIDTEKKDLFFGYLMQLCYVIKTIGTYIANNPDPKSNKLNIIRTSLATVSQSSLLVTKSSDAEISKHEGQEGIIEIDDKGIAHILGCAIYNKKGIEGKTATLYDVNINTDSRTNQVYKVFGKYKITKDGL